MITLFTFQSSFLEPSHSPFCVKAMILLNLSGETWKRKDIGHPGRMPHGKLPVIQVDGQMIADSELIQDFLTKRGADFYPGMGASKRAQGHAMVRMVEESLRYALVHDRWLDDRVWPKLWPVFFAKLPSVMRKPVSSMVRRSTRKMLLANGFARMTRDEQLYKVGTDLTALGHLKGDNRFMLGAKPTAVDAAVLPVLSMIDHLPVETELTKTLHQHSWVADYLQLGREQLYQGLC